MLIRHVIVIVQDQVRCLRPRVRILIMVISIHMEVMVHIPGHVVVGAMTKVVCIVLEVRLVIGNVYVTSLP